MSHRNLGWLLGIAAVALLGIAVSYSAPTREKDRDYDLVRLVVDVLQEVRQRYVVEVDSERERKLVEDMINGGLERLDPHSQYINPKEYKQFLKNSKGKFGGIGVQIGYDRQGRIQIHSLLVGTPAYESGIMADDLIVKVDSHSTENMRMSEVVDLIQGDIGQKVTISVLHSGAKDPVDIEIVRAEIEVKPVLGDLRNPNNPKEWDFFIDHENKIAYVRLANFGETAAQELRKTLEQLQKEGVRGLILDLRFNPGGLLKAAVEICDLFLTDGVIVSTRGRDQTSEVYRAKEAGTLLLPAEKYPVVVLINKYSASASEIVAAALQDNKRAIIIGERSYGKGSVQNVIEMENHTSALKLTTASYWRPNGKNIHRFPDAKESDEWGVKPNPGFEVPLTTEEEVAYMRYRVDRDVVHGKPGTKPAPKPATDKEKEGEKEKKPFEDKVLKKALDYLRGEIKKIGRGRTAFEISNG
jgi:carboxyl-terminal processing protease